MGDVVVYRPSQMSSVVVLAGTIEGVFSELAIWKLGELVSVTEAVNSKIPPLSVRGASLGAPCLLSSQEP